MGRTVRLAGVFACGGVLSCAVGVIVVLFRSRSALTCVFVVGAWALLVFRFGF